METLNERTRTKSSGDGDRQWGRVKRLKDLNRLPSLGGPWLKAVNYKLGIHATPAILPCDGTALFRNRKSPAKPSEGFRKDDLTKAYPHPTLAGQPQSGALHKRTENCTAECSRLQGLWTGQHGANDINPNVMEENARRLREEQESVKEVVRGKTRSPTSRPP